MEKPSHPSASVISRTGTGGGTSRQRAAATAKPVARASQAGTRQAATPQARDVAAGTVRCTATLLRPDTPRTASWTFVVLPADASARLPSRGMVSVDGSLGGHPFQATLAPDGQGSHWLKVPRALQVAAGVAAGDRVALALTPVAEEPEPRVPADLRQALAAAPEAKARWQALTAVARRDWVFWITSARQAATRERRIANTCDMLASGKRRVCCFDRSGMYGKGVAAPKAAAQD